MGVNGDLGHVTQRNLNSTSSPNSTWTTIGNKATLFFHGSLGAAMLWLVDRNGEEFSAGLVIFTVQQNPPSLSYVLRFRVSTLCLMKYLWRQLYIATQDEWEV